MMKKAYLLLIILLAVLLRSIGLFWGKANEEKYDRFQVDEFQHVEIAIEWLQKVDPTFYPDFVFTFGAFNAPGLGSHIAIVAYPISKFYPLKEQHLLIIGRLISLLYSVLMVVLLWRMGRFFFNNENVGLLAGLLYAVFDVSVTHGHYVIPAISYGFWVYFSIFQIAKLYRLYKTGGDHHKYSMFKQAVLVGLGLGMSMSVKYDYLPAFLFVFLLAFLYIQDRSRIRLLRSWFLYALGVAVFTFFASTLFDFSLYDFIHSFGRLYKENQNVVAEDTHWFTNPILYFFAVVAGSSLVVFLFFVGAIVGLVKKHKSQWLSPASIELYILVALVAAEFMVRWAIDTPFIRRANIFMPFLAMLAALGMIRFLHEGKFFSKDFRKGILALSVLYTLGICLVSQYNFYDEPRYRAAKYIRNNYSETEKVWALPYSSAVGLPPSNQDDVKGSELVLLHEAYYGRYTKSFSTPFIIPEKPEQIYHCHGGQDHVAKIQGLVYETGNFRIVERFSTNELFPERILFRFLFGSYEPFNGDLLILVPNDL